ncbi:MAG: beta strand repeat-containing protein, partial [Actinomycetota bacterium]
MADDGAAQGGNAVESHADDRTLLDDLTVLAQPQAAAPASGEARENQESERGGGIVELGSILQGTPDLAAAFVPVAPEAAAAKDSGQGRDPGDAGRGRDIDAIENARPVGPENSPRADGSQGDSRLAPLPTDAARPQGPAAPANGPEQPAAQPETPVAVTAPPVAAPAAPAAAPPPPAPVAAEPAAQTTRTPATTDDTLAVTKATVGAPAVAASSGGGNEDTAVPLSITVAATDTGDAITSVTIRGVPAGATLNHGTAQSDGSWLLAPSDLAGLTLTPPANFGGSSIHLEVSATAADSGLTATSTQGLDVLVKAVADTPTLATTAATGTEDGWIALSVATGTADTDSSETLAVTITGVPAGATLSAGTANADGSWSLTQAQLAGLKIKPASHDARDFTLTVTSTTTEAGDDGVVAVRSASTTQTLKVTVDGQATTQLVHPTASSGTEDQRINLNLSLATPDSANESLALTVSGVPAGAKFYAGATGGAAIGHDNGDGSWTFTNAEVAQTQGAGNGLFVLPPQDWNDANSAGGNAGMQLTARLVATQTDPDSGAVTTSTTQQAFAVHVAAVADAPTVTGVAAHGNEDTAIALSITPHLTAVTNTEAVSSLTITGVPSGAVLNHGTRNADGSWTLSSGDLTGLTVTPAAHDPADFTLHVTATSTEQGGNVSVRDAVSAPVDIRVTVNGVLNAPGVTVSSSLSGNEDQRIAVDLGLSTAKSDETLSGMTIAAQSGSGAAMAQAVAGSSFTLGNGTAVGTYDAPTQKWSFSAAEVAAVRTGGLYVQAPKDWSDWSSDTTGHNTGLQLTATVTATETDDGAVLSATTTRSTTVHVMAVADQPTVTAADVAGTQNTDGTGWLALNISPHLADADGSESITKLTVSDVPTGAVLNQGTQVDANTWTLTPAQLAGLKILPKAHDAHDFTLHVTATATEAGPNVAAGQGTATSVAVPIKVVVEATAEGPSLTQAVAAGNEDTRINMNLTLALPDTAEGWSGMTLANVPAGSQFWSAASGGAQLGTETASGSWSFSAAEVATIKSGGLFVLPPANWSDYSSAANHTDGMRITATLTGTKTDPDSGLVHSQSVTQSLAVQVNAVADTPTAMVTQAASGTEYDGSHANWIPLSVTAPTLVDADSSETLSLVVTGVPTGAILNHGTQTGANTWNLSAADLAGLQVRTATHDAKDFTLTFTATATEQGVASHIAVASASTSSTLKVTVAGAAETPTLTQSATATGNEDARIKLNLTEALADSQESLTMTITGVQPGSAFYSSGSGNTAIGHDNGNGSWSFSAAEMKTLTTGTNSLYIQAPTNWSDWNSTGGTTGMPLTVTLTSTETDPDSGAVTTASTAPLSFNVTVKSVADAPNLTVNDATGTEYDGTHANWIDLNLSTSVADTDGSESISSVVVTGMPATALLNHGTRNADGSWTLSQADLAGLKVQAAAHDAKDFTLTVKSTATEAGTAAHVATATASTTKTLVVKVAGVADTPTVTQTAAAAGNEDTRINLNLNPQLTDSGESLSMTLAGVPAGSAFYSAASGGSAIGTYSATTKLWSFSSADITAVKAGGLYVLPPKDWSDWNSDTTTHTTGMQLSAVLTSTQTDPDTNLVTTASAAPLAITVAVKSVADTPTVTVTPASGSQNDGSGAAGNWIALSVNPAVADTDGSESVTSVTISGVPTGAVLNQGTDNGNGSWTLTPAQLAGLKILPKAHDAHDFTLTVTATATEAGDPGHIAVATATGSNTLKVTVTGTAEAPVVTQSIAAVGNEDTRIDTKLSITLPDSNESYTGMTITGAPAGSVFYASGDAADATKLGRFDAASGTWSFTAAEIDTMRSAGHGLFVQPPKD